MTQRHSMARRARLLAATVSTIVLASVLNAGQTAHAATFDSGSTADLIVRNSSNHDMFLYRGNGSSGFSSSAQIGNNWSAYDILLSPGDFSGDGYADVLARHSGNHNLYLFEGNGASGFKSGAIQAGTGWGDYDQIFSAGDFDDDGYADVIARHTPTQDLYLYPGDGSGGFKSYRKTIGNNWSAYDTILSPGDFNGDRYPDVIARNAGDHDLYYFQGNGSTGFQAGPTKIGDNWSGMDTILSPGDFDGDGTADVIARNSSSHDLFLYRGNGSGGFKSSAQIGNNWGAFDTILSPAPRRPRPATPGRTNNLSKPVYFVHGYDGGMPGDINNYWGKAIQAFRTDGVPANLSTSAITFCYYTRVTGCSVNVGGGQYVPIVDVAASLAWNIYNQYSRHGIAVDLIGHSMGGLVVKGALTGVRKQDPRFPPYLFVEDGVTVSTPNAGVTYVTGAVCATNMTVQCSDMKPSSAFMGWVDDSPSSKIYTDWTFIGVDNDIVIVPSTAVPDNKIASHKVIYDSGQMDSRYVHMSVLDEVSGSFSYLWCDLDVTVNRYCDSRSEYNHVDSGFAPVRMLKYALYWNTVY